MLLSFAIEAYLKSLSGKNSNYTVKNYSKYLARFLNFISDIEVSSITPEKIAKYKASLQNLRIKAVTINLFLIALRSFIKYEVEQGVDLSHLEVELEYQPARKVEILDQEALDLILRTPDSSTLVGIRDKIILELIILSGLKASEILKLNKDFSGLDKKFELADSTKMLVNSYLAVRKDNSLLLINLSQRSIERTVEKYAHLDGYENITANTLIVSAASQRSSDPDRYRQNLALPG